MSALLCRPHLAPSPAPPTRSSPPLPPVSSRSPVSLRTRRTLLALPAAAARHSPPRANQRYHCRSSRGGVRAAAGMEAAAVPGDTEAAWSSFPHLDAAGEQLMRDMAGSMESELADLLEPSRTPADVQHFRGAQGSSQGSIILRAGKPGSKINFVLRSWLHAELPFGTLNIASLLAMLSPDTDAPHFLFEFIQTGPHSLVVVLDLLPRTDLVLDTGYLKRVYDDSGLDTVRAGLDKVPGVQPYVSPSLFVRSVVSPTAVLLKFQPPPASSSSSGDGAGVGTFLTDQLHPGAKQVFRTWLDAFRASSGGSGHGPAGPERDRLARRDDMIKRQGLEMDLTANLPRLFGQEVTDRVVDAFVKGK